MDFSSILGIVLGVGAIVLGNFLEGSRMSVILQLTAAIIVFGGTFGAVLLGNPMRNVMAAFRSLKTVFRKNELDIRALIVDMVRLSYKARRDGIISLEEETRKAHDPFLKRALNMAVDGTDYKVIKETMEIEMDAIESELEAAPKVYDSAGGIAPTIGILGAVLGLIHVMQNLTDPSKLGEGIAVAFVATVYGVGSANLIFIPIAQKLKNAIPVRMSYFQAILEGVLSIQSGDNPRLIEEKLISFLPSSQRKTYTSAVDKFKPSGL